MRGGGSAPAALAVVALLGGTPAASAEADRRLDFAALDLSGGPFEAATLAGEPVLVDFWAVWCAPCIDAFPLLGELHRSRGAGGVRVLGVALHSGGPDEVAAFLADRPTGYPIVVGDEELAERFGVVGFPTYFLFGPDGRLVETYVGKLERFVDELRDRVGELAAAPVGANGGDE